jgi:hypothetical protein
LRPGGQVSGKNVMQVQEWLGHSDLGFTLRTYVHLMDDGLGETAFFDDLSPDQSGEPTHMKQAKPSPRRV